MWGLVFRKKRKMNEINQFNFIQPANKKNQLFVWLYLKEGMMLRNCINLPFIKVNKDLSRGSLHCRKPV